MRLFFLLTLVVSSALFGILPPLSQSSRELQAILSDGTLFELLGSAARLNNIMKVDRGYLLVTNDSVLRVEVEYLPVMRPGPGSFVLHFSDPVPLDSDEDKEF